MATKKYVKKWRKTSEIYPDNPEPSPEIRGEVIPFKRSEVIEHLEVMLNRFRTMLEWQVTARVSLEALKELGLVTEDDYITVDEMIKSHRLLHYVKVG